MYHLFESIKVKEGVLQNVHLHNQRMNNSRLALFGIDEPIFLNENTNIIHKDINGINKFRVIYRRVIEKIEILPYQIKKINSLRLVFNDFISYHHKIVDRATIDSLYLQKGLCDDIMIIKEGLVTDTSYCNIVFDTGTRLITPSTPLLKGTKREQLLNEKRIEEQEIKYTDIRLFNRIFLINAMIDLEDKLEIPMRNVI